MSWRNDFLATLSWWVMHDPSEIWLVRAANLMLSEENHWSINLEQSFEAEL